MSEIVKVDGAWRIAKSQKAEFVREYLVPYLQAQASKRNLTGDDVSLAREGFGKIFIDGKQKGIDSVRRLFRTGQNPTLKDLEKNKVVKRTRSEGQYGYNEETQKQVNFLDDVEKLKAEYAKNSNDPNAGKIFDKKMSKLFRKNYRGRIKYDPTKEYGWPEGKSKQDFKKWQLRVYNRLKGEDGDVIHVGHGKPVKKGGTNSASNLALEDAKSNVRTGSREGTFRPDEELESVYVAHGKSDALQEYLAFEDDPNIMTPMDLLPEDHASLLQDLDQDPEAIFAQGLRKKENQALTTYNNGGAIKVRDLDSSQLTGMAKHEALVKETEAASIRDSQFKDKSQEHLEDLQNLAEDLWGASMDQAGLGAVKNTIYAGKAVLDKDPVGIVTNAAAVIPELKIVTDEPLIKTKLTHKVKQLPSEIEAVARDIAGKNY